MGFEPQVNPLFKALTGCLVAFWLHTVAPAQIKKTPGIFSPEFSYVKNRCAQRCSSHFNNAAQVRGPTSPSFSK